MTMAIQTPYSRAVEYVADSVLAQIEDGTAPSRQHDCEGRPIVRVYFADIPYLGQLCDTMPRGVVRVAVDLDPVRDSWPTHEVRVCFDPHDFDAGEAAADITAAILRDIASTAEVVR
jgi:hypothetical protein